MSADNDDDNDDPDSPDIFFENHFLMTVASSEVEKYNDLLKRYKIK
jgi:hypothetical protein